MTVTGRLLVQKPCLRRCAADRDSPDIMLVDCGFKMDEPEEQLFILESYIQESVVEPLKDSV